MGQAIRSITILPEVAIYDKTELTPLKIANQYYDLSDYISISINWILNKGLIQN